MSARAGSQQFATTAVSPLSAPLDPAEGKEPVAQRLAPTCAVMVAPGCTVRIRSTTSRRRFVLSPSRYRATILARSSPSASSTEAIASSTPVRTRAREFDGVDADGAKFGVTRCTEADGEQLLADDTESCKIGLVVRAGVGETHRTAGLEHHAPASSGAEGLFNQSEAILADVIRTRAQRVRVGLAEGVSHHEIGVVGADPVDVREDDPSVNREPSVRQASLCAIEPVASVQPRRRVRSEAAGRAKPRHESGRSWRTQGSPITRRVGCSGTDDAGRVVRGGECDDVDAKLGGAFWRRGVP